MDKEGMVAVVRGTKNSGLCVTLLDGTRKYTLLPNTVTQPLHTTNQASQAAGPNQYVVDNSAQVVDGRYASVYKTVHCNMIPTSPTIDVSEFPPQRVALCKGHGNFEVGGLGSGETTYYPSRVTDSFRGGLTWPERGSVFSPRPSVEPDSFANSLRKYPSISAERSTEMVERLISYAQFKNSKNQRLQTLRSESSSSTRPRKTLEADIRTDESPTRERSRRCEDVPLIERLLERSRKDDDRSRRFDEGDRRFDRSYEIRNFRDISRRGRESARSPTHPACPTIKERSFHLSSEEKREPFNVQISIETQVDIPAMSSKEVSTIPKPTPSVRNVSSKTPSVRNVAIPMSPLPSILTLPPDDLLKTSKSIQTLKSQEIILLPRKSVQTCFSLIDVTNKKIKNRRKSKSQEELRGNELEDEVLHLVHDLTGSEERGSLRDDLVKRLKKIYRADKNERIKIKFGRCVRDQLLSDMDLKDFTKELSNQLLYKIKKSSGVHFNSPNLYRAEIQSHRGNNCENCVDDIINEWLKDIPIKNKDYLGKNIKKDHLLVTIANKIKSILVSRLKIDSDRFLKTEIIQSIEDIPIAVCGFDKRLYLNRLATDLVRKIKETICIHKVGNSKTDDKNNMNSERTSDDIAIKEEEIKYYVQEELANFIRRFQLKICTESMDELEVELTDILLDAMGYIQSGKEEKVKEDILYTLFELLDITEYQANYFAKNMILTMKKIFNVVPKIKSQTFIVLNTQKRDINAQDAIDENYIKTNLVWYTNQIIQQINEWISGIKGLNPNDNFTKVVVHDLAGDIVDRHKYLEFNPATKTSKTDEIEHLKYQIFKWINKLVGDDNLETIDKASELMERIKNVPVPMLIKPQNTTQWSRQMGCDYYKCPRSNSKRECVAVDYGLGIGRSNITIAIGLVPQSKTLPSDSAKPNTDGRMSYPTDNRQPCCSAANDRPQSSSNNMPTEQKTQEQIIEEFDKFLKDWVQRIPMSEKPGLIEKCRLGIYNGIWKAISKIKMNPEALNNPHYYKDILDDEIEELLNCLTQTPELKKQRNGLKAEVLDKAADINMREAPAALNTSYKQQLVENISSNLPKTVNRVDHTDQDLTKLYEEVMKLHLAEYFILYTKYKEDDPVKANVFKRKLLKEVHELVDGIKETHGKELREIEIKQYVEGVIHALQKVPVPNNETIKLETDEIILALEVEQWFSDLPLMPNEERMDVLSRRKYRDMLAKKLFDLENSNEGNNENQMKEEITKFLKRMPFIPGQAENIPFMVEELMLRVKSRPRYDDDNKNAVAFVEPHGYEAFSRDMPLCSSFAENQNGSSYMIMGGGRAADRSMAYGGQHVQGRDDLDTQQEWQSLGQSSAQVAMKGSPQGAAPCCGRPTRSQSVSPAPENHPNSQRKWQSLGPSSAQRAMNGSPPGTDPCCGRPTCSQSKSLPPQGTPDSQDEWLSLEQSGAPGAMEGSPQGADPCCGRPTRSQSISPAPEYHSNSQKEWQSLGQSPAQRAVNGSPSGTDPCFGRPTTRSQSTSLPPQRSPNPQQEWQPLGQRTLNGTPEGAAPCCGRSIGSQSTSLPPQPTPNFQQNIAPGAIIGSPEGAAPCCGRSIGSQSISHPPQLTPNSQQNTASDAIKGSPEGAGPCCGRSTCSQSTSPPRSGLQLQKGWLSLEQSKAPSAVRDSNLTPKVSTSSCCKRANCPSQISTQSQTHSSLPLLVASREQVSGKVSKKQPNAANMSRGQSPASNVSNVSRGQSPARALSDDKSEPVTTKTKPKKSKKPPRVECQCFETPGTSKTRKGSKSPPAGGVSRRPSPASSVSDDESRPVKSKTKPKKTISPLKGDYSGCRPPKLNRNTLNTTQTQSGLPGSTRRIAGSSCCLPDEISNRPVGYSTPQNDEPERPNICRAKRRNRDIEQDRREGSRRRLEMEDSEESGREARDDLRCKCMERVWRWKRKMQCRPCDEHTESYIRSMLPFMMCPPPPYYNGYF